MKNNISKAKGQKGKTTKWLMKSIFRRSYDISFL
jgi:hypothetical protein